MLYTCVLSSDETTMLNELPNLKTALQTRFRESLMLDATFIICDANYNAVPNEIDVVSLISNVEGAELVSYMVCAVGAVISGLDDEATS